MVSRKLHRILVILLTVSILNTLIAPTLLLPSAHAAHKESALHTSLQQQNTIAITDTGFNPTDITIQAGESVTWVNQTQVSRTLKDGEPPVNGCGGTSTDSRIYLPLVTNQQDGTTATTDPEVDVREAQDDTEAPTDFIEVLAPGTSFAFRYETAGTFPFHLEDACQFFGSVTVLTAATATPTPTPTATPSPTPTADLLLAPIGGQTALLGSTLTIQLRSDRSAPRFDVAPLPLPENASFDAGQGIFRFAPSSEQIGNLTLTFSARDGVDVASETVTIAVPEPDPNAPTALRGRILDANDADKGIITPLIGATVKHIDSGVSVTTDGDGYFTMSGLQPGENYFEFNGITAQPAGTYGAYRAQKVLIGNVTNVIERPIYIMAIDMAGQTQVDPEAVTVVQNPNLTTTMTIPAHTVMNDADEEYSGPISISEVPDEFTPGSLPDWLDPGMVLTIQPMGLTFAQPAPISFPNFDNLPPASEVDLWSMDHETARFFIAGRGRVSSDGTMINTIDGGIRESSWHFPMPPSPDGEKADDNNEESDTNDDCQKMASSVGMADGCLLTSIELPAYTSLGQAQTLNFVYSSKRAYPQLLIPFRAVISSRAAVPRSISYSLTDFGGIQSGNTVYLDTNNLSESRDEPLRGVVPVDAQNLSTGVQPYNIRITSHYAQSDISGDIAGRQIVVNEQSSAFGAGWGLSGLSRIQESFGGRLLLVNGDGTAHLFRPQPLDLTAWKQEGRQQDGNWIVSEDGTSVFQTINTYFDRGQGPTFFVSPQPFLNTTIRGTFLVDGNADENDDDYIGFVIGYQSPQADVGDEPNNFEFLLFDWKKVRQDFDGNSAPEGFSLLRVDGTLDNFIPGLFNHVESPGVQVLATDFGDDKGWTENVAYDFELNYQADRIRISINGQVIFDVTGEFPAGKFGFYNYSQAGVRYNNFSSTDETARFVGPVGDYSTIVANGDGTYTRRLKSGTVYTFDADGRQTAMMDRNGNRTNYGYDGQNRLNRITDPAGKSFIFTYEGNLLRSVTDSAGRITVFTHNAVGDLVRVTYPDSSQQNFGYDERHLMTSEMDRRGETRTREYDAYGRLVSATLPENVLRRSLYSQAVGVVAPGSGSQTNPVSVTRPDEAVGSVIDGEGRATVYRPGPLGRPSSITDPAGFTSIILRDTEGNPLRTTLPSGANFEATYDNRGNVLTFRDRTVNGTSQFTYDRTFNQITSVTDPFGEVSTFTYDAQGNLVLATTPLGRSIGLSYGNFGLPVVMTDTLGTATRFTYDATGNPLTITSDSGASSRATAMTYTAQGYVAGLTDALGRSYGFTYDGMGRVTDETLPGNRTVIYGYDGEGNLTSLTPPGQPAHQFEYDGLGQVTAYIPPTVDGSGTTRTTYAYNKAQELTQVTRPDGKQITYVYDEAGRLSTQTQPRGTTTLYYSGSTGQLTGIAAPDGVNLDYSYQGELLTGVSLSGPVAGTVNYSYDANYRLIQDSVNGSRINYSYDADDALTQAGDLILTYNATTGLLSGTTLGSVTDSYTYNGFGEMTGQTSVITNGTDPLYNTSYTYDALGRITGKTEVVAGQTTSYVYGYDAAGRLEQVTRNGTVVERYAYDANGNRTRGPNNEIGSYDAQDRLLSYGGATYSYTANGELLTKTENGQTTSYDYDVVGNLMGVTLPDGTQITYLVDGQDRRIGKRVNGTLVQGLLYQDQLNPIAELDGSGNLVSRFIYGSMAHVPDYMVKGGVTYRILSDHLGSVRLVINEDTGEVVQQLDYDAWGNVLQDTNSGFQPFGFAGGLYDGDTNLVRFGARDYDAEVGRWMTKDPIVFEGDGANLYTYVYDAPINFIDPEGLETYVCKKPLNVLPRSWDDGRRSVWDVSGNPLFHEYICVKNTDGGFICGGQDRAPGGIPGIWSKGKASNDYYKSEACEQKFDDNNCIERCLRGKFAEPRPRYGLIWGMTDCQEWVDDTLNSCQNTCNLK